MISDAQALVEFYLEARAAVEAVPEYQAEVEWQAAAALDKVDEQSFLADLAYVILCSGMRQAVVRGCWDQFSKAFDGFRSAGWILDHRAECRKRALAVFNHEQKVEAILEGVRIVAAEGWYPIRDAIGRHGVDYLLRFPYIGPVIKFHLGKNLGLDCVKPDRHLVRMAQRAGFGINAKLMCEVIQREVGDKLCVIDIVLWRYATMDSNYLERVPSAQR